MSDRPPARHGHAKCAPRQAQREAGLGTTLACHRHKGGTPRDMGGVVLARLPCAHGVPCACQGVSVARRAVPATFRPKITKDYRNLQL